MINDYECGGIAQRIINGTDKLPMPDRKRHVYLVYEDWHGFQCVCGSTKTATETVKKMATEGGLPIDTPIDYEGEERWGWEGVAWWVREEVIE